MARSPARVVTGNAYAYAVQNSGGRRDPLPSLLDRGNFIFAGVPKPGSELGQVQCGFDSNCNARIDCNAQPQQYGEVVGKGERLFVPDQESLEGLLGGLLGVKEALAHARWRCPQENSRRVQVIRRELQPSRGFFRPELTGHRRPVSLP